MLRLVLRLSIRDSGCCNVFGQAQSFKDLADTSLVLIWKCCTRLAKVLADLGDDLFPVAALDIAKRDSKSLQVIGAQGVQVVRHRVPPGRADR